MTLSITLLIIIPTVAVSIYAFSHEELRYKWMYNPFAVFHRKEWYRIFTHALLHGSWMHLFFNIYVLWMFGDTIEYYFKLYFGVSYPIYYVILYLGGVVFACIPGIVKHRDNHLYNSLGASGAVSAIIFTSIMLEPTRGLGIIFLPGIHIPAFIFGPLYLLLENYLDKKGQTNIAHDAHIYGAIFGVIFPIVAKPIIAISFLTQIQEYLAQYF